MKTPPIVSAKEWDAAWQQMLVEEKKVTRARDALAAKRRRMPWLAVEKPYEFVGPDGKASLLDLFDGRRQLIVYRAFFGPKVFWGPGDQGFPDHACVGCSLQADHVPNLAHLNARDTTLVYASPAPAGGHRAGEVPDGLGAHPVVHDHRRLRQRLWLRRVARP